MIGLAERVADKVVVFLIFVAVCAVIGVIAWGVDILEGRYREYEKKRRDNGIRKYDGWRKPNRERSIDKSNQRRQKGKKGKA